MNDHKSTYSSSLSELILADALDFVLLMSVKLTSAFHHRVVLLSIQKHSF